jgi:hypothetical protein
MWVPATAYVIFAGGCFAAELWLLRAGSADPAMTLTSSGAFAGRLVAIGITLIGSRIALRLATET